MKLSDAIKEYIDIMPLGGSIEGATPNKIITFKNPYSPATVVCYKKILKDFIKIIGDKELQDLTVSDCRIAYNIPTYKTPQSKKTLLTVLNRFLKMQNTLGRIPVNPMKAFKDGIQSGGRDVKIDTYYLPTDELKELTEHLLLYNTQMGLGCTSQVCLGLRQAETIGNEWSLGTVPGTLHGLTPDTIMPLLKHKKMSIFGKGKKWREVLFFQKFVGNPISKIYFKTLQERVDDLLAMDNPTDDRIVQYDGAKYNLLLKDAQKKIRINVYSKLSNSPVQHNLTSQILRHSFAMSYIKVGGKTENLQKLMGHEDSKTTGRYAEATKDSVAEEHERIENS